MRNPYAILLAIVISLYLFGTSEAGQFKVIRVYYGDTFKAEDHDIETEEPTRATF